MTFLSSIRNGWRGYWDTVAELRAYQVQAKAANRAFDDLGRRRLGERVELDGDATVDEWGAGGRQ